MSSLKGKITVYEGADHRFYWRFRRHNGFTVATGGEGYSTQSNARRAARKTALAMLFATVVNGMRD